MSGYLLLFAAALVAALCLGYPVRALALRLDVVDRPTKRKMHQIPIPLMGGLAIYASFALVSGIHFLVRQPVHGQALRSYLSLLAGGTIVLLVGLYDDIKGLSPVGKFSGQLLAALAVVWMGARVEGFTNPLGASFDLGWLGAPLAVLWIVGITNAVNLIDGLDGLAAGIGGIAALGLFAVALPENAFVAASSAILAGAAVGFLRHNFYPAKVFLGDTGSMFIGFALAVISMHGSFKATTATVLFLPIIVLGVPIFDTLFAILRRAKRKSSPFQADREHIHHRLVRIGLHHRTVVLIMYFVSVYLAVTAYGIAQFPYRTAFVFLLMLTTGGIIALRTIQFVEDRLEGGLLQARQGQGATQPRSTTRRRRASRRGFCSLVCEVGGFRADFGEEAERQLLCEELRSMLSRRMDVRAIVAEMSAPGEMILILRTEPIQPHIARMVEDGVAWYLEEHRQSFSSGGDFPRIRWIRRGPTREGLPDSEKDAPVEAGSITLREGRAGVVGT